MKKSYQQKSILLVTVCFLLVTLAACGYTTRSMLRSDFKTIYIEPFQNKIDITGEADTLTKYRIYRPKLEIDITQAVVSRFLLDGNLNLAKKDSADITLKGELVEFRRDPLRYTDSDEVEEYRLNLVVNLILWDNRNDKEVWQANGFTGDTSYFVIGASAKSEATAVSEAIDDLARRIVERTIEEW